jgi:MurNAc alpha-1-phosphate uridylyltransferase
MILAAGRGERMRPLTDVRPKPLLEAGGKALIEWQVARLAAGGFRDIVVNHAHLGHLIEEFLGDGSRFGVTIRHSREEAALETAGGIARALPLLGAAPFLVVSGDVYTDYDYGRLMPVARSMMQSGPERVAHFVLVDNPPSHPRGDFSLEGGIVGVAPGRLLNYGGISVFLPGLFTGFPPGCRRALFPWMMEWVDAGRVSGEHYGGTWANLGTPEQLEALDRSLRAGQA